MDGMDRWVGGCALLRQSNHPAQQRTVRVIEFMMNGNTARAIVIARHSAYKTNRIKYLWFRKPMHVFIYGQWWSRRRRHLHRHRVALSTPCAEGGGMRMVHRTGDPSQRATPPYTA